MASTTFLYTVTRTRLGSLELDASISESHSADVEVTDHPVERGFNVTDHARPAPEMLSIEGFVSNTPIQQGDFAARTGEYTDAIGRTFAWEARAAGDSQRAENAYAQLRKLKDEGTLVTVATSLRTYTDMLLTSLSVPRDATSANGLRFNATLKQIRTVTSQTVEPAPVEDKVAPKKALHTKAPETVQALPESILSQAASSVTKGLESLGLVR